MSQSGGSVLFIHGLIGHMHAREIERRFEGRALFPDLLGYGKHREYAGTIDLDAQVEHLANVVLRSTDEAAHLVGHSVGGVIAFLFARRYPERVRSITSVEGNFTLKDAFWSKTIAESSPDAVEAMLQHDRDDPIRWLRQSGVTPSAPSIAAARSHLDHQPARTVHATARSVVAMTGGTGYLPDVAAVLASGIPLRLIAGERSRDAWDVPAFVLERAQPELLRQTGHLVTIESPSLFGDVLARGLAAG